MSDAAYEAEVVFQTFTRDRIIATCDTLCSFFRPRAHVATAAAVFLLCGFSSPGFAIQHDGSQYPQIRARKYDILGTHLVSTLSHFLSLLETILRKKMSSCLSGEQSAPACARLDGYCSEARENKRTSLFRFVLDPCNAIQWSNTAYASICERDLPLPFSALRPQRIGIPEPPLFGRVPASLLS